MGDGPTSDLSTSVPDFLPAGARLGPYLLREKLGEGGMGEVWLAEQQHPVRRRVAIKVIKLGMNTREVVARFEAERQALAIMEHPGIARMFDGGVTPEGRPYFVMEFFPGEPITGFCDARRLSISERLPLFVQVCHAVQHAHQKAIIHRDLKPSNILVWEQDGRPSCKVIDFGIAKAVAAPLGGQTLATQYGAPIGTPEYMSPEQLDARTYDIDTRTDIYSLGVVLYELLSGTHPLDVATSTSIEDVHQRIREQEPLPLSVRLRNSSDRETIAARHSTTTTALMRSLHGDLSWIALKALEKDRNRRYGSPADLAADIERHLRHEPVSASPPSTSYRARRFIRRHRFGVMVAAAGFVLLIGFSVAMAILASRLARERDRANEQSQAKEYTLNFLKELFTSATPEQSRGSAVTARELLDRGARRIGELDTAQRDTRAELLYTLGDAYVSLGLYPDAERLLREAMSLNDDFGGSADPATVRAAAALGHVLERLGRYQEVVQLLEPLLKLPAPAAGHDEGWTRAHSILGLGYLRLGRVAEAEPLLAAAAAAERNAHGESAHLTLSALHNLSMVFEQTGRAEEAVRVDEQILRGRSALLGETHPQTLATMNNLASKYTALGRLDDARRLLHQAIGTGERVFGAEHPQLGVSVHSLGEVEIASQNFREAEELITRAVAIYRPQRAQFLGLALYQLAQVVARQGRSREALAYLSEAAAAGYKPSVAPDADPHLASLQSLPEFQATVAGMKNVK